MVRRALDRSSLNRCALCRWALGLWLALAAVTPTTAQDPAPDGDAAAVAPPDSVPAATPSRSKQFGDWSALRVDMTASRLCFAVTRSRSPSARRGTGGEAPVHHLHVAAWPEAGIRAEVSVRAAVPLRSDVPARLVVGADQFKLFAKDGAAFVSDPLEELRLLEAMKKGSQATFNALTDEGVPLNDTFSLNGMAAALAYVTQGCP